MESRREFIKEMFSFATVGFLTQTFSGWRPTGGVVGLGKSVSYLTNGLTAEVVEGRRGKARRVAVKPELGWRFIPEGTE